MKKKYILIIIILVLFFLVVFLLNQKKIQIKNYDIEIINTQKHQVTIAWTSDTLSKGNVYYENAAKPKEQINSAKDPLSKSYQHEVKILGLKPSTYYNYWISDANNQFQFKTQPKSNLPFSFLLISKSASKELKHLISSELPDFVVSLTNLNNQYIKNIRPYVQVYDKDGIISKYQTNAKIKSQTKDSKPVKIDWGGLVLIFLNQKTDDIKTLLDKNSSKTIGIIVNSDYFQNNRKNTKFHKTLKNHNKKNPNSLVAFVIIPGKEDKLILKDNISYWNVPTKFDKNKPIAIRIDFDIESITAVFLESNRQIILKSTGPLQEKTCDQCRKLADIGYYKKSIKAYKNFILNNKGHFQIDDAYFAIAQIYDEKLFDFKKAKIWYNRLIKEYPKQSLSPIAKHRLKYLCKYSDYDFIPLTIFEKIKKNEYLQANNNPKKLHGLIDKVKKTIDKYPKSNIAPYMQFWIANQLLQIDYKQAIIQLLKLKYEYPNFSKSKNILTEIADIYYNHKQYKKAKLKYIKASDNLKEPNNAVLAQIDRCDRNIFRVYIAIFC